MLHVTEIQMEIKDKFAHTYKMYISMACAEFLIWTLNIVHMISRTNKYHTSYTQLNKHEQCSENRIVFTHCKSDMKCLLEKCITFHLNMYIFR